MKGERGFRGPQQRFPTQCAGRKKSCERLTSVGLRLATGLHKMSDEGKKDPKWKRFEKLAYEIQREFAGSATVTLNDSIQGIDSKVSRQIDISVRQNVGQYPILVVIDCKDYRVRVDVKAVEEFGGLVRDVRANRGALISSN